MNLSLHLRILREVGDSCSANFQGGALEANATRPISEETAGLDSGRDMKLDLITLLASGGEEALLSCEKGIHDYPSCPDVASA